MAQNGNFSRSHCLLADRGTHYRDRCVYPRARSDCQAQFSRSARVCEAPEFFGAAPLVPRQKARSASYISADASCPSADVWANLHTTASAVCCRTSASSSNRISKRHAHLTAHATSHATPSNRGPRSLGKSHRRSLAQSHRHTRRIHWHFILPEVCLRQ